MELLLNGALLNTGAARELGPLGAGAKDDPDPALGMSDGCTLPDRAGALKPPSDGQGGP